MFNQATVYPICMYPIFYRCRYQDGDAEDLVWAELVEWLVPACDAPGPSKAANARPPTAPSDAEAEARQAARKRVRTGAPAQFELSRA